MAVLVRVLCAFFYPEKLFGRWLWRVDASQGRLQLLVQPFSLAISLGVEARGETHWNTKQRAEFPSVSQGPQSETLFSGRQGWQKTCWRRSSAISFADGSLDKGRKCANLENLSTIVRMTVLPSVGERPVTKSKAIWCHGMVSNWDGSEESCLVRGFLLTAYSTS